MKSPAGIYLYEPMTRMTRTVSEGVGLYKTPVLSDDCSKLSFFHSRDSVLSDSTIYNLRLTQTIAIDVRTVADTFSARMPAHWGVSIHFRPYFSESNDRLFFGISPLPVLGDTIVGDASERAELDVWHYGDDYIPPVQLKRLPEERKRSYLCVANALWPEGFIQAGHAEIAEVIPSDRGRGRYALGLSSVGYRLESQWTGVLRQDVYVIDFETGRSTPVLEGLESKPELSPGGNYIIWFNRSESHWYVYDIRRGRMRCLTCSMLVEFQDSSREVPDKPGSYGLMGWGVGDKRVYIYDEYDIWSIDVSGVREPEVITRGYGRANEIVFRNIRLTTEYDYIKDDAPMLFRAFNKRSKEHGFYSYTPKRHDLKRLQLDGYTYSVPVKARDANVFIYTKGNFRTTPDLWCTSTLWDQEQQLSRINPQMSDYYWGDAELVSWLSKDDYPLEGILYKPEGFDSTRVYPLLIYFYEKHSDDLYRHFAPVPSRSTISIPFYCSRGYLVFTPDIHYIEGHPGRSAYNAVVSGAEYLCKNSWVDRSHIGIQGQSWGGYQVSYLVTQTDMFAAAGAGAPVVNMTSAYGGIRWSTGLNRQMQYERQQSRIGKTLWEGLDLYLENSPLFSAYSITTPLLIMHNDRDGAVPWYQGIEFFTALRRLNKTAWMLQYNGEEHNLTLRRNQRDLSIRLQQFFDHYLKGAPMPMWMRDGIPALRKGRTYGLELTE